MRVKLVEIILWTIYIPLIAVGHILSMVKLGAFVLLYEFYGGMSLRRIRQDVYDRFFTSIEQRVSPEDIYDLKDTFRHVEISQGEPY